MVLLFAPEMTGLVLSTVIFLVTVAVFFDESVTVYFNVYVPFSLYSPYLSPLFY